MLYDKGMLRIDIANTFNGVVRYETNCLKTTSSNEKYHGYGLENVDKTLKKYQGSYKAFHSGNIFHITAVMYITAKKR